MLDLYVQIDDAFLPYMYEKLVPPMTLADYRKWAQMRIDALNHALRGIPEEKSRYHMCWEAERPARVRRADEGHRRPDAAGEGRRLCLGSRQSAPRARMGGVEACEAAARQDADPRLCQPRHQHRRAS